MSSGLFQPVGVKSCVLLTLLFMLSCPCVTRAQEAPAAQLRLMFSENMFTDINRNDAIVAVKLWIDTIVSSNNIAIESATSVTEFENVKSAVVQGRCDALGLLTPEYLELESIAAYDPIYAAEQNQSIYETYVVLVPQDSPAQTWEDLGGLKLLIHNSARNCLAEPWMERSFRAQMGKPHDEVFLSIRRDVNLSKAILPVFFGKVDACLVARKGFDLMSEMNPQVRQQLRVLAESEPFVPAILAFLASYDVESLGDIFNNLMVLHSSAAGKQMLNIFRSEKVIEISPETIQNSRKLMAELQQLRNDLQ